MWFGFVNAKNGFGGYNGPREFFYSPERVVLVGIEDASALSERCFGPEEAVVERYSTEGVTPITPDMDALIEGHKRVGRQRVPD